ncbi:hypothetical protein FOCG_14013 [Fusarium oxysporum f. sp. radicis-lycopersici 26381]|uniref:Uncharacterized protein n=4 Tax=Fusarium oxysporum TaxID=5507 RepID=A0A2H3I3L1_FUSOX|nr:hypothetical protein FOWG_06707 [Fusarium oxysporum f. sp. lycopersici MN25]EXL43633.1 hypothetical protein FOCG_14013 [Fusarium oxysporum f. sp. radicis-lycopersici 26381]KAJ4284264.1 hypothetical protein NW764_001814 [Fusarium oxysporum]PCD45994.1 hypothetical protein AU210_001411 [Fusarium oxysporum f. sp. radicis-cucumerinum]RKK29014.1 hypothetical protein BFJ65_g954 [Fusarium oxysporum f. sp. cepae]RYC84309.1 hypothetical protein BFJ63_vAg12845 [Fusarium oxysporum f. sp. narcissi]
MLQSPSSSAPATVAVAEGVDKTRRLRRKRKAETQDNERLSKRLSLLNLEQSGNKLYVPVEQPTTSISSAALVPTPSNVASNPVPDETMQLDDSKHKVYIYNMDDELSSDSDSDDPGKLVFLPDIEKHLRANRIPPSVLANSEGELAGMQVVLYSDPKSLTVPEDKDSVRKAIIESRNRTRELQRLEREGKTEAPTIQDATLNTVIATSTDDDPDAMDLD